MTHEKKITSKLINTATQEPMDSLPIVQSCTAKIHLLLKWQCMSRPGERKGVTLSSCLITIVHTS